MWGKWKAIAIWKRSLVAILMGIVFGLSFKTLAVELKPIGDTFLNLLKMIVIPLIFISLVHSITNIKNTALLGKIAGKAIFWFIFTTAIAISLAIIATHFSSPGVGATEVPTFVENINKTPPTILGTLFGIIPSNAFQAFATSNILQVIFLAVVSGIAITKIKSSRNQLNILINNMNEIISYVVSVIVELIPVGVFAMLAYTTAVFGYDILIKSATVIVLVMVVLCVQLFVVFPIILMLKGHSVRDFFRDSFDALIIACAIGSSNAALPATLKSATKMKIREDVKSFVIPLGSTINMNGSAVYQTTAVIFMAQILNIDLTLGSYFLILVTAIISATGTAGVSGGGLVTITLIMSAVGIPLDAIALVIGIDRILDLPRTSLNIGGDLLVAKIIAGDLDKEDEKIKNELRIKIN